jgi:hypothetical protein
MAAKKKRLPRVRRKSAPARVAPKSARPKKPSPAKKSAIAPAKKSIAATPAVSAAPALTERDLTTSPAEDVSATAPRERGSYDGDTAIKLYLREIGQVRLLTPQENRPRL